MPKHHCGFRSQTRSLLRKKRRERGLSPLTSLLIKYEIGDLVDIKINPSVHKAMPHRRFHGKTGRIVETRGKAFVISVSDKNKKKQVITTRDHFHPNHLLKKKLLSE
ncbi:MAG: 50S ribosomal protein L21e [Candidatus Hodarchaeota archaeon]